MSSIAQKQQTKTVKERMENAVKQWKEQHKPTKPSGTDDYGEGFGSDIGARERQTRTKDDAADRKAQAEERERSLQERFDDAIRRANEHRYQDDPRKPVPDKSTDDNR